MSFLLVLHLYVPGDGPEANGCHTNIVVHILFPQEPQGWRGGRAGWVLYGGEFVWADVLCRVGRVLCQRPVNMFLFSGCVICIQKMLYKFLFFVFCV